MVGLVYGAVAVLALARPAPPPARPSRSSILSRLSPKATYSQKKIAAVRWRVSQQRADIEREKREITALEQRLSVVQCAALPPPPVALLPH